MVLVQNAKPLSHAICSTLVHLTKSITTFHFHSKLTSSRVSNQSLIPPHETVDTVRTVMYCSIGPSIKEQRLGEA